MTTALTAPQAVHVGVDDLPFVDIGGGNMLKVMQVRESEGLWIIENIFQAGFEVQTHRHTGPVCGYTQSGAWKYKEYDYVNRAGSFLYEPAGSVHTLHVHRGQHPRLVPDVRREHQPRRRRQHRRRRRRRRHARALPRDLRGKRPAPARTSSRTD